jgi:hypothetical protein
MITSVQMDFSVLPRCKGNEIGLFEILDKLILSTGSDSIGGDGNHQQYASRKSKKNHER